MNNRIKELRKNLGMTLETFGERLGVTKVAISNIERGNRGVTNQMFSSICREFNVNEAWLRDGTGDMFASTDEIALDDYAKQRNMSEVEKEIFKSYFSLPEDTRKQLLNHLATAFSKVNKSEEERTIFSLNAAHEIPGASEEDKKHDEDIMDDEDF